MPCMLILLDYLEATPLHEGELVSLIIKGNGQSQMLESWCVLGIKVSSRTDTLSLFVPRPFLEIFHGLLCSGELRTSLLVAVAYRVVDTIR